MVIAEYKKKPTPEKNIKDIVKHLRKNKELLNKVKYLVSAEVYRGEDLFEELLENQLEIIKMEMAIKPQGLEIEDIINLIDMWKEISKVDMGYLLEYIVEMLGPYKLNLDFDSIREAKMEGLGNHNFDVIFFNRECEIIRNGQSNVCIVGQAEFHECKRNVATFIPDINKKQEIKSSNQRKLNFMKKIFNKDKKNFNVYITSLINNKDIQDEYLKDNEFDCIEIISVLNLIK